MQNAKSIGILHFSVIILSGFAYLIRIMDRGLKKHKEGDQGWTNFRQNGL